jgi:hypothetical protein
MSGWLTIRYYCQVTWLAFCLRPLPHFQPSPSVSRSDADKPDR